MSWRVCVSVCVRRIVRQPRDKWVHDVTIHREVFVHVYEIIGAARLANATQ